VVINGQKINNQSVVPYDRDPCVQYDAHINVKRVVVRSGVKYLYKYVIIVLIISLKVVQHLMTLSKLDKIDKVTKCKNIWIVAIYLQLNHANGF